MNEYRRELREQAAALFNEGKTQAQIGQELGVSRQRAGVLLNDAAEMGLVDREALKERRGGASHQRYLRRQERRKQSGSKAGRRR